MLFSELSLAPELLKSVDRLGFKEPTPVQVAVIPEALQGFDLMVSSQTGSGKTAAFLLPTLQGLLLFQQKPQTGKPAPTVVALCPTRELAQQVANDAIDLVRGFKGIRIATVIGGTPYGKQLAALKGANLVVATPGRLLDLAKSRAIKLDQVKCLILDEADRMLDLGFAEDLEALDGLMQDRKQTLMFSATFAGRVMTLATELMNDPKRIELATAKDRHDNIAQTLHWADDIHHKHQLLNHLLQDSTLDQALIFASTQIESEEIADRLRAQGVQASALHGAMPQPVRNRRLDALRKGHTKILVATDVAARGIDVPTISHVINFGLPMKAEDYVHRIGRTGRAGRSGIAVTLAEHRDRAKVEAIERFTAQSLPAAIIEGLEPKRTHRPRTGKPPQRRGPPKHHKAQASRPRKTAA